VEVLAGRYVIAIESLHCLAPVGYIKVSTALARLYCVVRWAEDEVLHLVLFFDNYVPLHQSTPRCSLMECIIFCVIGCMVSFIFFCFTIYPVVIVGGVSHMTQRARGA